MKRMNGDTHEKMVVGELPEELLKTSSGITIIKLKWPIFEYGWVRFWYYFETIVGGWFANRIERRSIGIILRHVTPEEKDQWDANENRANILVKYRRNFGRNVLLELFEMKTLFVNKGSKLMQHLCKRVSNADALDDVYNVFGQFRMNGKRMWPESAKTGILPKIWLGYVSNGQSVRNRYHMVKELYKKFGGGKTLSIACGSAQPLIHAIHDLKEEGRDQNVHLLLTDAEDTALQFAKRKAEHAGVTDKITFLKTPFTKLSGVIGDEKFDIVEACGILDYLPDPMAVDLLRFAINSLTDNGMIIFSNMSETYAAETLRRMFNWEITYRKPEYLGRLVQIAGGKNIRVYVEPWGIHPVVTATR